MENSLEPDVAIDTCKNTKKPLKKAKFNSYLSCRQSLQFKLLDNDWLHIKRLKAFKREELRKKRNKNKNRLGKEPCQFQELENKEQENASNNTSSTSSSSSSILVAISSDPKGFLLQGHEKARKKEHCSICEGTCSLFRRKSRRRHNNQDSRIIRSSRSLQKDSDECEDEPKEEELVSTEDITVLYGKTRDVLEFLQDYKIPKIKDMLVEDHPIHIGDGRTIETKEKMCAKQPAVSMQGRESKFDMRKRESEIDMLKTESKFVMRKRESKFDYRDKFSSSDEDEDNVDDFESTYYACSQSHAVIFYKEDDSENDGNSGSEIIRKKQVVAARSYPSEDVLSLFAEEEDIRLPIEKMGRRIFRGVK